MLISSLMHRIYADFLMPSRLQQYRSLLIRAAKRGYAFYSIQSYWCGLRSGFRKDEKILILRHDVDTDVEMAKQFFVTGLSLGIGVRASYFFRLGTLDLALMREIHASGSEASYHFEEVAAVAKEKRLRSRAEVLTYRANIQERFCHNLHVLRSKTALPMRVVAAHGDFVNRLLGVPNHWLLDARVRAEAGVDAEVYDPEVMAGVTSRFIDGGYPVFWRPYDACIALERGDPTIYILIHPRHWRSNPKVNFVDNARRVLEGLHYRYDWPS